MVETMNSAKILEKIYNANASMPIPDYLYHEILVDSSRLEAIEELIKSDGFKLSNNPNRWTDINEVIPNRPKGLFFWGPEQPRGRIRVRVADLDTSKLWAFPAELANAANQAVVGYEMIDGALDAMQEAKAVPFAKYDGSFAAEWIYTGDIAPEIIEWRY
jgi:hypothetical protein